MKKLVLALIVALTLAPFTAFGLEMMTDDSMKDVTAQAGVAIALDDVVLEQYVGETKYIDMGGLGEQGDVNGALVISDRHKIQYINAIYTGAPGTAIPGSGLDHTNYGIHDIHHDYSATGSGTFKYASALLIDIGTCPILTHALSYLKTYSIPAVTSAFGVSDEAGWNANNFDKIFHMSWTEAGDTASVNVVGVIITLPTVEIYTTGDMYDIGVEIVDSNGNAVSDATYHNEGRNFIRIKKADSSLAILGGRLEIAPK